MSNEPTHEDAAEEVPSGTRKLAEAILKVGASVGITREEILERFEDEESKD